MKTSLKAFGRNEKGSVAIIFALSLIPVLGVSGIAVDYSRLHSERSSLQDVVDGAAVAVARYPGTLTTSEAKKLARQYVKAHLQEDGVTLKKIDVSLSDTAISVTGTISMPTTFMGLFGYKTMETAALGEVVWASAMHYEIALVLDNTGSMEGTKMTELKKAANTFIDLVTQRVPDKDNLKIGVVPFSTFVNVGKNYKDASWIDVDGKSKVSNDMFDKQYSRFKLYDKLGIEWPGCVETRLPPYDVTDEAPTTSNVDTLFTPTFYPDDPDADLKQPYYANNFIPDMLPSKDGVARTKNLAKYLATSNIAKFDRSPQTVISNAYGLKGPDMFCDQAPVRPLTNDYTAVRATIADMKPAGSTNIPEGVMWGWRVLSPGAPFTEGAPYSDKYTKKILVLLTDGENNFNVLPNDNAGFYTSWGYYWTHRLVNQDHPTFEAVQSALDTKMTTACTNIKNVGIEVFTIRLEEPSVALKGLLSACATDNGHFSDAPSAVDLDQIFAGIVTTSTNLRIAR